MSLSKNQRRLLEWLNGKKGAGYYDIGMGSYQFNNAVANPMVEEKLIEADKVGIKHRITAKGRKAFRTL